MFIGFILGLIAASVIWFFVIRNNRKLMKEYLDVDGWAFDCIDDVAGVGRDKAHKIVDALKNEIEKI